MQDVKLVDISGTKKKREYLKDKINELAAHRTRTSETYIEI
jgi:hypothetical protein